MEMLNGFELASVDGPAHKATFKSKEGVVKEVQYTVLHAVPPMSAPDFIKSSPLAAETGFVNVDKDTMQHVKYPNVYSIGDCANLPTSKTAAAITSQAPVLVHNLVNQMKGKPLSAKYDGYTACPIFTGFGCQNSCPSPYLTFQLWFLPNSSTVGSLRKLFLSTRVKASTACT